MLVKTQYRGHDYLAVCVCTVGVATLRGTLPWIAPEIIKTPGSCTEAVDVYSFGRFLFGKLTTTWHSVVYLGIPSLQTLVDRFQIMRKAPLMKHCFMTM